MFEMNMTFEQAIAWANARAQATEYEQLATERQLAETRESLYLGPPTKELASEIKRLLKRIPRLGKAIKNWLKLAGIWASGQRARLIVSFSGGRTSALMAKLIKRDLSHLFELVFVFANTGREDDRTLVFVDQCDREYGLNLMWVEAIVNAGSGVSTTHRIVTFETATRLRHVKQNPAGWSAPFLEVVRKYGIPNDDYPHCTRELKIRPINSYVASIGWSDYFTAIGIRKDEDVRLDLAVMADQFLHLLSDLLPLDKQDVLADWEDQPFDLDIEEDDGNCVECQKKWDPKLFKQYAKRPEAFAFSQMLDEEFSWHGAPHHGIPVEGGVQRKRWRGNRTTEQLIAQAKEAGVRPHIPIREMRSMAARQFGLDFESDGCSESCEAYLIED